MYFIILQLFKSYFEFLFVSGKFHRCLCCAVDMSTTRCFKSKWTKKAEFKKGRLFASSQGRRKKENETHSQKTPFYPIRVL